MPEENSIGEKLTKAVVKTLHGAGKTPSEDGPDPQKAAHGEHHVFFLSSKEATPVTANDTYLGVDVVAVSVNMEEDWRSRKTAVGSVDISIKGKETINRLIGPYDMEHGAKRAPQFDIPLLDDQPYNEDSIKIEVKLRAIEKGTVLLDMLRAVVDWGNEAGGTYLPLLVPGLTLVTAASAPVEAANKKLMASLSQLVFSNGKEEPIFNPQTGIVCHFRPLKLNQSRLYVLFHRGTNFRREDLTVIEEDDIAMPALNSNGAILSDGAWVLLRIRRHSEVRGTRPWYEAKKTLRSELRRLEEKMRNHDLTARQALSALMPDPTGRTNLYSAYSFLYQVILTDPALTDDDADRRANALSSLFNDVKERISQSASKEGIASPSNDPLKKQLTDGSQIR